MKLDFLEEYDFFTGVPDSLLAPLSNYLMKKYGVSKEHIIAPNEGTCVALAAGYHLATGKVPVVYLQNSGIGNIINPVASLLNDKVYGIPCIFIIGWRGEPNVKDEPQHLFQGEITLQLLKDMDIALHVIDEYTSEDEIALLRDIMNPRLAAGRQVAFVVKKNALTFEEEAVYQNDNTLSREAVIERIASVAAEDIIISTTGKASRELFEIRSNANSSHERDFLTVGSMGHSSSIALAIAQEKPEKRVWCIDGDGAVLMHMGALALIGSIKPQNLIHVIINNGAHESVGGMPTVADSIDFAKVAEGCGYPLTELVETSEDLDQALLRAKEAQQLTLIEVRCALGSRSDLGRPTTTTKQNKKEFMAFLSE